MPALGSCAFMGEHGCIFVGGGSSWHFRLQALSWEAVSAPQLVPSQSGKQLIVRLDTQLKG